MAAAASRMPPRTISDVCPRSACRAEERLRQETGEEAGAGDHPHLRVS